MSVTINLNNVQATLVNETNIKSLNGTTILGSGQITVDKTFVGLSNVANVDQQNADNITSGTLGGARLPNPQTTVLGGVKRNTGTAGQFVTGISASGDLEYSIPTGGGDVTGAASSVNNNIAVFDGTTGKIIKDGGETIASINSSINGKEPAISAGTTGQYFRGDKTFQNLNATAVGLGNVANVDQQNADNITSGTLSGARLPNPQTTVLGGVKRNTGTAGQFVSGIDASGNLEYSTPTGGGDVTGAASSVNNNIAVFDGTTGKIIKDGGETIASINSSINGKENTITATTSADYYRGDKTFQPLNATAVGLGNVANVDQQNADNITSGTLSGARLPNPQTTVLGGVKRNTGTAGQFVNGIDASGNLEYGTPAGGGSVDELQIVLLTQVFS